MANWMEKHFGGVADPPKKLRDEPPKDRGTRFWLFLLLLLITPIAFVGVAWWLGYLDPIVKEVVRIVQPAPHPTERPGPIPNPTMTYTAKQANPVRSITQARANELRNLITSRKSGLDLMGRDRAKATNKYRDADAALSAAKSRLVYLERHRPSANDARATYEWNIAHSDAVAAGKNATSTRTAQQKVLTSFDGRITKAEQELEAAEAELDEAVIVP